MIPFLITWLWRRSHGQEQAEAKEFDTGNCFKIGRGHVPRHQNSWQYYYSFRLDGSIGQSRSRSFCRTDLIRSSGKTPIAPLMTETCRVVSLSTRTKDGLLRPVFAQSEWVALTATAHREPETVGAEVMKATKKSSGELDWASMRHGRRLLLDKSVKGNAACTISPDRNMGKLFSELRIYPSWQNVEVTINIRFFFKEIEGATGLRKTGNLRGARIIRFQRQHCKSNMSRQRHTNRQFQHAVGLDTDFNCLHWDSLRCRTPIAKAQRQNCQGHWRRIIGSRLESVNTSYAHNRSSNPTPSQGIRVDCRLLRLRQLDDFGNCCGGERIYRLSYCIPIGATALSCSMNKKPDVWQGTLALMVLKTLERTGSLHGYGIARQIELTSANLLNVNYGTLYPALLKLEQEGYIASHWGVSDNNRKAKYYELTRAGHKQVEKEAQEWERMTEIVARFLIPKGGVA